LREILKTEENVHKFFGNRNHIIYIAINTKPLYITEY